MFAGEVNKLKAEKIKPLEQLTLEPYERDHAVVVGIYRWVSCCWLGGFFVGGGEGGVKKMNASLNPFFFFCFFQFVVFDGSVEKSK